MEHGTVTTTRYDDGVVYCNVQAIRYNTEYEDVPVLKPHSGFIQLPEQGERVAMHQLDDGTRFIGQVLSREGETPDSISEGELVIQLDGETWVRFEQTNNDDWNLNFGSSGDMNLDAAGDINITAGGNVNIDSGGSVFINGTSFSEHKHDFKDSTIADTGDGTGTESTTTKTTKKPN